MTDYRKSPPSRFAPLTDRPTLLKAEIEKMVHEVGEQPNCEMKRSCSLTVLAEKIEFVKDIQSIATSRIEAEKYLVVGADDGEHKFYSVLNIKEFDDAPIRQILEKYLAPIPEFQIFRMTSSDGHPFVLFVIPKQKIRRILARETVVDTTGKNSRLLIREGDLWTKGSSTGKRLATPEDWDEIYEDKIEYETELRTRQRVDHALEQALVREKVKSSGTGFLPSYANDDEFLALMEGLCGAKDLGRFNVLLERLRDDLIESWGIVEPDKDEFGSVSSASLFDVVNKFRDHVQNVFRPALRTLTLAGILTIKNSGPTTFLDSVVDLFEEVFNVSHKLFETLPTIRTQPGQAASEHLSFTVPALESMTAIEIIGAYMAKRNRYEYLRSLFRASGTAQMGHPSRLGEKSLLVFWPLRRNQGEPIEVRNRDGQIEYSASRVEKDPLLHKLFGSTSKPYFCQYELCIEFNSWMGTGGDDTKASRAYLAKTQPGVSFTYYPSLIGYPLDYIGALALNIYTEIETGKFDLLNRVLFDPSLIAFLKTPGSNLKFARMLAALVDDRLQLSLQLFHFPPSLDWPKPLHDAMALARQKQQ
jgi:hypothetical protein